MKRQIIRIDGEKCNGCGLCVSACHEGAIGMDGGKAVLLRDDYCDGLGDCLPVCPTGAITFEEREAAEYDKKAVDAAQKPSPCGCPGSAAQSFEPTTANPAPAPTSTVPVNSELRQWPIQIKLVPINAPYFDGANLLIAADCAAYAYGNFHAEFMRGKVSLIGCPKLDEVDYSEKLTAIIADNDIKSVTIVRMEVPCCVGIENAAVAAPKNSGKFIPWQVVTLTRDGKVL